MKNWIMLLTLSLIISSCATIEKEIVLKQGIWQAELKVMDNQILPFNFQLSRSSEGKYSMDILNAEEVITVDEITINGDSIIIRTKLAPKPSKIEKLNLLIKKTR